MKTDRLSFDSYKFWSIKLELQFENSKTFDTLFYPPFRDPKFKAPWKYNIFLDSFSAS